MYKVSTGRNMKWIWLMVHWHTKGFLGGTYGSVVKTGKDIFPGIIVHIVDVSGAFGIWIGFSYCVTIRGNRCYG